jgi:hypothetical protein
VDAQIGTASVKVESPIGDIFLPRAGLFNLEPHPGQPGLLGFTVPLVDIPVFFKITARTGSDYGLTTTVSGIPESNPLGGVEVNLWGVPADPIHDPERLPFHWDPYLKGDCSVGCGPNPPTPSNGELKPFLENPTSCQGPLTSSLDVLAYDDGTDHAELPWPATTGCDQLSFDPSLVAHPTTTEADSPSGLDVDLKVPQFESPTAPSPSEIRGTTVTLPKGFSINPNAADGKTSCADAEAHFGTEDQALCPEFAKLGTLVVETAALPGPLPGAVYIGQPQPGNRYRLFLVADGFGVHIKLPGSVHPDPQTGQIVASFQDLPQTPFQDFNLHFFGAERGILATPDHCGTYQVNTDFEPWDNLLPHQHSTSFFTIDSGPDGTPCPPAQRPFAPHLRAGVTDNTGGAHSPFSLLLSREDGDQNLASLYVTTPPGFAATLKGVPYCPGAVIAAAPGYSGLAEAAHPSCPAASQIGTASAGAGAGNHPFYAPGKVYLAGPYRGAPLSLVVITPAVSGPYDLGNVVVRAAIEVDPATAQVTTVSDPLPQILEGIPLRLRSILVNLDRPGFTLNPTNCDPFAVQSRVSGDQGAVSTPSAFFQAANCSRLAFGPKLSINLKGGTRRSNFPALRAVVVEGTKGEANVKRASVALPHSEFLEQSHIGTVCTRVQFAEGALPGEKCPAASVYGFARAVTPLLDKPVEGPVYLRSSSNLLPDLVASLRGQINVVLDGHIDTDKEGGIRATFPVVPDAEVSKFVLEMKGGKKGLLVNSENLCRKPQRAVAKITAQNGKTANQRPLITNGCASKPKPKAAKHGRAHR